MLEIWGKTNRGDRTRFHPLLYHLLDVAFVAERLWDKCLPPGVRLRLAQALGLQESDARSTVVLLAGLHDIGKASPPFQRQSEPRRSALAASGLVFPNAAGAMRHGEVSTLEVWRILTDGTLASWHRPPARILARIVGGHHGIFPEAVGLGRASEDDIGNAVWADARNQLATSLQRTLGVAVPENLAEVADSGIVPLLAGFISVADWLGSSETHFPTSDCKPLEEYPELSRERALRVLRETGWLPAPSAPASERAFEAIFHFAPRPMQEEAARIANEAQGPYLLIIEEQMGGGKTEAALFCADRVRCRRKAGFYVALPTQATSNAMYRRVQRDYLPDACVHLVHGSALLNEDYHPLPMSQEEGRDEEASVAVESWFTARKRPLLAPFGVGTIDQSLLAVLQTKHWFVRLFGLAGKTVIFDEAHAYDIYMTDILKRLLEWLSELGCTVIILSATLPTARRAELARAYAHNRRLVLPPSQYPRLTTIHAGQASPIELPREARTPVQLDWHPADPTGLLNVVNAHLPDGGCGAIICNTVARAQEVFESLRGSLSGWDVSLFHARFPAGRRRQIEATVLDAFGREGTHRPNRAILVATQVVEQSLDLDFDWIASDFAPVDLLLQRMGRLWRHMLERPADSRPVTSPYLTLLCDGNSDNPDFGVSTYIYEEYILLRSFLALRECPPIAIPHHIEDLVEAVYGEEQSIPNTLRERVNEARENAQRNQENDQRLASGVLVTYKDGDPETLLANFNSNLADDENPNVHQSVRAATRLGRPSLQVVCLESRDGSLYPFGDSEAIDLGVEPDVATTRRLLDAAVPISHPSVYHALRQETSETRPPSWRHDPHLRHARMLVFTEGRAEVTGLTLTLNNESGLTIPRALQGETE